MSFFESIELLPEDPILGLPIAFAADTRQVKANLGVGTYRTADGNPLILPSVKKAEEILLETENQKEYLPIEGNAEYLRETIKLVFGKNNSILTEDDRIFATQCIGGSGALRVGGEFLSQSLKCREIFISNPTWPNHRQIFKRAGLSVEHYPYYCSTKHTIDFDNICASIKKMSPKSIIVLHASCHNPTGADPTFEQWKELSELILDRKLITFFDFAYQGFGESIEKDAEAVRYFASKNHEMFISYSNSKNFGLYGERLGALIVITQNREITKKVGSNIKQIIRGNYSTPPLHGSRIVSIILNNPNLRREWEEEVNQMRMRVTEMRQALVNGLATQVPQKDFSFMLNQRGIFSFSGLSSEQVQRLRQEYAIYMPSDGRINVAGLNKKNLQYVVDGIQSVINS
jgi:aspartate/tyrosine/aromatic aminotransferase